MISSGGTSSPVSASTLRYLIRWPVARLIWLKLIFSESDVAGYNATGQVTRERRRKPFQLARGAMMTLLRNKHKRTRTQARLLEFVPTKMRAPDYSGALNQPKGLHPPARRSSIGPIAATLTRCIRLPRHRVVATGQWAEEQPQQHDHRNRHTKQPKQKF